MQNVTIPKAPLFVKINELPRNNENDNNDEKVYYVNADRIDFIDDKNNVSFKPEVDLTKKDCTYKISPNEEEKLGIKLDTVA